MLEVSSKIFYYSFKMSSLGLPLADNHGSEPFFTNDTRRAAIDALQCAVKSRLPAPRPMPPNSCVSHTYLNLGVPVPIIPHRLSVLQEGNALLKVHGLCNLPVPPEAVSSPGRFIVAQSGHCYALTMVNDFGVKFDGNHAPEVLHMNTVRDMLANNDIRCYQLSTVEASLFMRGGWMPPWVHSRDMVCGAREMVKKDKKKAEGEQAVVVNSRL